MKFKMTIKNILKLLLLFVVNSIIVTLILLFLSEEYDVIQALKEAIWITFFFSTVEIISKLRKIRKKKNSSSKEIDDK